MASALLLALAAPPARALSCDTDLEDTPETLLANRLVSGSATYDLAVVGRVTDSTAVEGGREFTAVTDIGVTPLVIFGPDASDGGMTVRYTQYLSGDSVRDFPQGAIYFMALSYSAENDLFVASDCSLVSGLHDPESTIAVLVGIARDAGVDHVLVPVISEPTTTSPALRTTTTSTTAGAPGGTIFEGMVELPARGWRVVALGLVLLGVAAAWLWWLGRRSDIFGRD